MRQAVVLVGWILVAPIATAAPPTTLLAGHSAQQSATPISSASPQSTPKSSSLERVLQYIPESATVVVAVPCVDDLTAGLAAFGKAIGAPDPADRIVSRLLESRAGEYAKWIDRSQAAAIAALPGCESEPLLIATLRDLDAVRTSPEFKEIRDGVYAIEVCERVLCVTRDRIAVVGECREDAERALAADGRLARKFTDSIAGAAPDSQLFLQLRVAGMRAEIDQCVALAEQMIRAGMLAAGPQAQAGAEFWNWMFGRVHGLVEQADVYTSGVRFDASGISYRDQLTFRPDGAMADYLKRIRTPARDLLRGLPDGSYGVVYAAEWETPPDACTLNEEMFVQMLAHDELKAKLGEQKFAEAVERSRRAHRMITGFNGVVSMPADQSGMRMAGFYFAPDGAKLFEYLRSCFETSPEFMNAFNGGLGDCRIVRRSESIAGREVDAYAIDFNVGNPQVERFMAAIYGAAPHVYLCASKEGVANTFGSAESSRIDLERLLSPGRKPLLENPRVAAALEQIARDPQILVLLDIPQGFNFAVQCSRMFGAPTPPIAVASDTSPYVVYAVYLRPHGIRSNLFVPSAPINAIARGMKAASRGDAPRY